MLEFFRGWKRKVGCVTLLMAFLVIAAWVRSCFVTDEFVSDQYKVAQAVVSMPKGLRFETRCYFDGYFPQNGYVITREFTIPYVSLAAPLTAVSAWLLLSKPRAKKVVEPTPK